MPTTTYKTRNPALHRRSAAEDQQFFQPPVQPPVDNYKTPGTNQRLPSSMTPTTLSLRAKDEREEYQNFRSLWRRQLQTVCKACTPISNTLLLSAANRLIPVRSNRSPGLVFGGWDCHPGHHVSTSVRSRRARPRPH